MPLGSTAFLWSALFWLGVGALFFLHEHAFWGGDRPVWPTIVWETLVQWGPYVPLTPPLFAAVRALVVGHASAGRRALVLLGMLLGGVALHLLMRGSMRHAAGELGLMAGGEERMSLGAYLTRHLLSGFPFMAINYVAVLGVALVHAHRVAVREREREAEVLRRQIVDARLTALRAQLQPHFLFNALHAIGVMARSDPEAAARMVTLLGDLLRRSMEESDRQEVPLREELQLLQPYLAIQEMRFQDRLQVEQDVAAELLDGAVPSFALQPLVENAVRHGVEKRVAAGRVTVSARREGEWLVLRVDDDGPGPPAADPREGIGLGNLRARLQALYGERQGMDLEPLDGGGTRATLRVPWRVITEREQGGE